MPNVPMLGTCFLYVETRNSMSLSMQYLHHTASIKVLPLTPVPTVQPEVVYTVSIELTGSVFDIGVEGKMSLSGPGGVTFTLHQTGLSESSPEMGPIAKFLYSP